ncbi:hypothetical protein FHS27_006578 [Rhodopirellula rubra]|uniref:Uncharacterized protein n=1 Tax=Aporhodopirellula rubra TaxID=980271 RepID=A0A7W5HA29_9BACT|nr:hypothetical protein [Aporhodopirellula rubra]MBB3210730.1 hypothetical protein [Aporhodopirellula rubra]
MTDSRMVYGPKRLLKQPQQYLHIPIEYRGTTVADVFVASQELSGLEIAYIDADEDDDSETIGGAVMIGNGKDGYYNIDFELTPDHRRDGMLDFADEDYDLSKGRAFLVKTGYQTVQLSAQSFDEALKQLP